MKVRRALLAVIAATPLVLVATGAAVLPGRGGARADSQRLEGSWLVTASPVGLDPFPSLMTFISDGGFILSGAAPVGISSTGHGEWLRTADRQFTVMFMRVRMDPDGKALGFERVHVEMTLDPGGELVGGPFHVDVLDTDGTQQAAADGTFTASRLHADS